MRASRGLFRSLLLHPQVQESRPRCSASRLSSGVLLPVRLDRVVGPRSVCPRRTRLGWSAPRTRPGRARPRFSDLPVRPRPRDGTSIFCHIFSVRNRSCLSPRDNGSPSRLWTKKRSGTCRRPFVRARHRRSRPCDAPSRPGGSGERLQRPPLPHAARLDLAHSFSTISSSQMKPVTSSPRPLVEPEHILAARDQF